MSDLVVETAENGFVVYEGNKSNMGMIGKKWAFETATSLAVFIKNWGDGNTKTETGPENSGG